MTGRSIFRILAIAISASLAFTIQAFTKLELENEYKIKVDDEQKSVMLPSGSTVTESEYPLIHITHPTSRRVFRLAGERQKGQYYIKVDGQLYSISNLVLVNPGPGPVVYSAPQLQTELVELLKQEKEQMHKRLESLSSQLKLLENNNKILQDKLKTEQQEKSQLEKKVEDSKSTEDKLQQSLNDKAKALGQERAKLERDKQFFQQELEKAHSETSKAENELENERAKQKEAEARFEKEKTKLENQHKQQQKQQNKLREELEQTRNQASKDADFLKKQHRSELKSKETSHKKEVSELINSKQQLSQNNQKLKEDLKQAQAKVPTSEKSTQYNDKEDLKQAQAKVPTSEKSTQYDDNDWLAKPDEINTLNSEESSSTPGHENDSNPSSVKGDEVSSKTGKKGKKGKKKKKKKKKAEKQSTELPDKYEGSLIRLSTIFQELSESENEKDKSPPPLTTDTQMQENYKIAIETAMDVVLDSPPDEADAAEKAAEQLITLLTEQLHYFREKKAPKQARMITYQIHLLIIRYRDLFPVFTPLSELNQAFNKKITIEEDFLALTLIQVVHEQEFGIFEALQSLIPERIKNNEDLDIALQALLYGLMVSDIRQIEKILAKLIMAPLGKILSDCCFTEASDSDDNLDLMADENAECARKIFSFIVYIKRMTDFQLKRITSGAIWSDIDRLRIRAILHDLQTLLDYAAQNLKAFEAGDARYVEKHKYDELKTIHPDEISHPQNWLGTLDATNILNAATQFYLEMGEDSDGPPGYEVAAKPWESAVAGVLQQLHCLQQPLVIPTHLTFDPEGRLTRMGVKMVRSNAQPCLFDIARLARRNKVSMIHFLQELLQYIVNQTAYGCYFDGMKLASEVFGKKTNLDKFLTTLIASASETGTAVAPQWGEPAVFQLIARFLKRPVMLVMMAGHTNNMKTIALFFQPGHIEVNYTTVEEVVATLQEHQNVLIIGFIAHPPQASAATTAPGGYWLEMTFDAQAAAQSGTVAVGNRRNDQNPGDNSTNNNPPSQPLYPNSGLVAPAHLLPGIMEIGNNQAASGK